MSTKPELYRGYLIALTWCYAVYKGKMDAEPGQRQWAFVKGFWTEEEAKAFVDSLVDE